MYNSGHVYTPNRVLKMPCHRIGDDYTEDLIYHRDIYYVQTIKYKLKI